MRCTVFLVVGIVAACAAGHERRYVQYADSYTLAVQTVADAVDARTISTTEGRHLQAFLTRVVRPRIDAYKQALARAAPQSTIDSLLAAIEDAMALFAAKLAAARGHSE